MPYLHIAFDSSVRASLRQAFPDDRTLAFWDDLSFGSIDSPDPRRRAEAIERDFGFAWQGVADQVAVWDTIETEIGAGATDCIAWYSRRSVVEFANFLAFNEWMGTRPFRAVDLTDVEVPPAHRTPTQPDRIPVRAVGCLNAETIQRERLTERATTPSPEQRAADRLLWDTLRAENAPIRIVRQGTLVSAGIDVFDGMLRAFCPPDWRGMAYPPLRYRRPCGGRRRSSSRSDPGLPPVRLDRCGHHRRARRLHVRPRHADQGTAGHIGRAALPRPGRGPATIDRPPDHTLRQPQRAASSTKSARFAFAPTAQPDEARMT